MRILQVKSFVVLFFLIWLSYAEAAHSAGEPFLVDIKVEQQTNRSHWNVTYKFSKAVDKAVFYRSTNLFRHSNWVVETPNVNLVLSQAGEGHEDREEFVSKDGTKFDAVVIRLESYFGETPKDYEFFLKFTDESQLMYTGHFNVYPPESVSDPSSIESVQTTFTFISLGNRIFYLGNGFNEKAVWKDPNGAGTYVYFGEIQPLQTDLFVGIIDPGMPGWLKATLFDSIPKLFSEYTQSLKFKLVNRPIIFFNYKKEKDGLGAGGGVLPGVIQMRIEGKDWESESADLREHAVFLIAHEAAHLWNGGNGQLFIYDGPEKSFWMHEGGANALAFRASYRMGVYGQDRLNEIFTKEVNNCIELIGTNALNDASKLRIFGAYYSCGSTIGLLVEAATRKLNPNFTLFDFWSELFKRAESNDHRYSQNSFLKLMSDLSSDSTLTRAVEGFVNSGVANPKEFFREQLKAVGVTVEDDTATGKLIIRDYRF
jgi:hypothetical protein